MKTQDGMASDKAEAKAEAKAKAEYIEELNRELRKARADLVEKANHVGNAAQRGVSEAVLVKKAVAVRNAAGQVEGWGMLLAEVIEEPCRWLFANETHYDLDAEALGNAEQSADEADDVGDYVLELDDEDDEDYGMHSDTAEAEAMRIR